MGVSCIVDPIAGKMGLIGEQNVTNHMGVRVNPVAQFQLATYVRSFKMLNVLDVVNNTGNSHSWDCDNRHGTVKSNVWCGVSGDHIIDPCIFVQHLTGDIYANFLQHELPALLQNVPLQT